MFCLSIGVKFAIAVDFLILIWCWKCDIVVFNYVYLVYLLSNFSLSLYMYTLVLCLCVVFDPDILMYSNVTVWVQNWTVEISNEIELY